MGKKQLRNDFILIAVLLLASLAVYFGVNRMQNQTTENGVAVVTLDGEEILRLSLSENAEERIELPDGEYNLLIVSDGEVRITEASCPDQICVHHRAISKNKQSIACLPHELLVEIQNGEEAEVDASTN